MRTKTLTLVILTLIGLAVVPRAEADLVQTENALAITGPGAILINFEDLAGVNSSFQITDWYEALGLTVSGGLRTLQSGLPLSYDSVAATNGGVDPAPDITFQLATGRAFGFDIFTLGASVTTFNVTAYWNGIQTLNQTLTFGTGGEPHFVGIVELDPTKWFDTVVVSSASEANTTAAFAIDNVRMKVPDPGSSLSLLLFGGGAVLLAARARRAQKA